MRWRAVVALAVYVAAPAALALTGERGLVRWGVVLVAVHIGLGLGVARAWALPVPVLAAVVALACSGSELSEWLWALLLVSVPVGLTALGWALASGPRRLCGGAAAVCLAAALAPVAASAAEYARRGPELALADQRRLPIRLSLGNLCPEAETPAAEARRLRAQAERLLIELRRRPNHLVTYTFYYADGPSETRDITVRELAEEQLADLEAGGRDCRPSLQRRLRAAM